MRLILIIVLLAAIGGIFLFDIPGFSIDNEIANTAIKGFLQVMIIAFTYILSLEGRGKRYNSVVEKVDEIVDVNNRLADLSKRQSAADDVRTLISVHNDLKTLARSFADFIRPIAESPDVAGNSSVRKTVETQINAFSGALKSVNDRIEGRIRDLQPQVGNESDFMKTLEAINRADAIVKQYFPSSEGSALTALGPPEKLIADHRTDKGGV